MPRSVMHGMPERPPWPASRKRDLRLLLGVVLVGWTALFVLNLVFNGLLVAVIVGAAVMLLWLGLIYLRRRNVRRRDAAR